MTLDDDTLLEEELHWRQRDSLFQRRVRPPPGATAITAFGLVYMLLMWGLTVRAVGSAQGAAAAAVFVVCGVEVLIAGMLARATWRAVGPTVRAIIRPTMVLGPWPPILLSGLFLVGAFVTLFGPDLRFMSRGENWGIPVKGESASFRTAQKLCSKLGPQWRLPREDEVASLEPTPPVQKYRVETHYWLEPAPGADPTPNALLAVNCERSPCTTEIRRAQNPGDGGGQTAAAVVCVDF